MKKVFESYRELFHHRYEVISSLDMGEDSIRYDFFLALQNEMKLNPWDIQLEFPMGANTYIPNPAPSTGLLRKEKPIMDLRVETPELRICVEFGFFRRNSNDEGSINQTDLTFKMLNDFIRLGIYAQLNQSKGYFVCVADSFMLEHQLRAGVLPPFPGERYNFHYEGMVEIMGDLASATKGIKERFFHRFRELNLEIDAVLVYNEEISTVLNPWETRILIWELNVTTL